MRHLRNALLYILLTCALCATALASEADLAYGTVPHVLRPGKLYDFSVQAAQDGAVSLTLLDLTNQPIYTILQDFPVTQGENLLTWDGTRLDHSVVAQGEYILRVADALGGQADTDIRIGAPYPMITDIVQSASSVSEDADGVRIDFAITEPGSMDVRLVRYPEGESMQLAQLDLEMGESSFQWRGLVNGERVAAGSYALVLTLRTANGAESMPQYILVDVQDEQAQATQDVVAGAPIMITDGTPQATAEPTPAPTPEPPTLSPPYSAYDDGTYWSMTPGETDTAAVWDILTQPITVYDDGKIGDRDHVYMMENPDGTGAKVAQIHGRSQGLHVIGEENEHGYVLVEAFSNYDPDYQPKSDEEREHAFDLKTGYLKASGLKTVEVKQDIALVIDKLTQRMYLYIDGEPVTEYLIATGKISDGKYYNETIAGEYITISHTGGFTSGNMYCDMAIRINGGILLHEVPHKVRADGSKDYSSFEGYLGTKQSHGCVRIQRLKTPEGYNHRWLWDNLDRKGGYKVIIWDDIGRVDNPTVWQPNPTN